MKPFLILKSIYNRNRKGDTHEKQTFYNNDFFPAH
jgi:hypothetical protein